MNYCYSNNGLSMRAVADNYVAQSGEVLFSSVQTPEQLGVAFSAYAPTTSKASIQGQISALEASITLRMMREAFLGSTASIAGGPYNGLTAAQAIASVQAQIVTLRAEL